MPIGRAEIKRLAGLELNALRAADALPEDVFENARVTSTGTVIHDVNESRCSSHSAHPRQATGGLCGHRGE